MRKRITHKSTAGALGALRRKKAAALLTAGLLLAGCGQTAETSGSLSSAAETQSVSQAAESAVFPETAPEGHTSVTRITEDRVIYYSIAELAEAADLIVVGEFAGDTVQEVSFAEDGNALSDAVSRNTVSVKKVIKGEPAETLTVSQSYAVSSSGELVAFSGLSPMRKGESWVFFLSLDESGDTYWCEGDFTGRYPLPTGELREKAEGYLSAAAAYEELLAEAEGDPERFTTEQQKAADGYISAMEQFSGQVTPEELGLIGEEDMNLKLRLLGELLTQYDLSL